MNDLKYVLTQMLEDLKLFFIFLIQLIVITLMLYSVSTILLNNYNVKRQFVNFNISNSYAIEASRDKEPFNKELSKEDTEKLYKQLQETVLTTSVPELIDIGDELKEIYLTTNMDLYNHKYIEKDFDEVADDDAVDLIIGSNYKNNYKIGQVVPISFDIYSKDKVYNIKFEAHISGILREEQYIISNELQKVDDALLLNYEEVYKYIPDEAKDIYLEDVLSSSILTDENDDRLEFEKKISKQLEEKKLRYEIVPLVESVYNSYLIIKSSYDSVLFYFLIVMSGSILVLISYLKVLYNKRRKYYTILILYGKSIYKIIVGLIAEVLIYQMLNIALSYLLLLRAFEINYIIFGIIIVVETTLLIIPILCISKFDKKVVTLIKGVK